MSTNLPTCQGMIIVNLVIVMDYTGYFIDLSWLKSKSLIFMKELCYHMMILQRMWRIGVSQCSLSGTSNYVWSSGIKTGQQLAFGWSVRKALNPLGWSNCANKIGPIRVSLNFIWARIIDNLRHNCFMIFEMAITPSIENGGSSLEVGDGDACYTWSWKGQTEEWSFNATRNDGNSSALATNNLRNRRGLSYSECL